MSSFLCPNLFYWNKGRVNGSISIFFFCSNWIIFSNGWPALPTDDWILNIPNGYITECLTMLCRPIPVFKLQNVEKLYIPYYCLSDHLEVKTCTWLWVIETRKTEAYTNENFSFFHIVWYLELGITVLVWWFPVPSSIP